MLKKAGCGGGGRSRGMSQRANSHKHVLAGLVIWLNHCICRPMARSPLPLLLEVSLEQVVCHVWGRGQKVGRFAPGVE